MECFRLSTSQVSVPTKSDSDRIHSSVVSGGGTGYMWERESALLFFDPVR